MPSLHDSAAHSAVLSLAPFPFSLPESARLAGRQNSASFRQWGQSGRLSAELITPF